MSSKFNQNYHLDSRSTIKKLSKSVLGKILTTTLLRIYAATLCAIMYNRMNLFELLEVQLIRNNT